MTEENSTGQENNHTNDHNAAEEATHDAAQASVEPAAEDQEQTPDEGNAEEAAPEREEDQEANQETKPEGTQAPEDLFDLMGDAGNNFKKKKPEPAKTASNSTSAANKAQAKKPEPKTFPSGSTVVYSGHKIELEEEMTADQLIAFLEDDFPELTKENTEFTHDEARRRIVPNRKALKKGAVRGCGPHSATDAHDGQKEGGSYREPRSIQVETEITDGPPKPVRRVLHRDGVYEIRNTTLGSFIARFPSAIDIGLREGAYLKVPRAPASLLEQTVQIFKERADREVMLTITYNHRDREHHLVWPPQTATATSITYDAAPETDYLTTFLEIHSHNTMEAYFSPIDDGSEIRATGLYGVVGRVDLDRPAAAFRFSCGTHRRQIYAEEIFEDPERIRALISEKPR